MRIMNARLFCLIFAILSSVFCIAQTQSEYGKYNISRLTPSVQYCGLKIKGDDISFEIWNDYTVVELTFIQDAKEDAVALINKNYEAKMPGILNFLVGVYKDVQNYTVVRERTHFLPNLIKNYQNWKQEENKKRTIAQQKAEAQKKAQLQAEQMLYSALMARILSNFLSSSSSGTQYQYNGLYFNNQAEMEDYKNANGLK